MQQKEHPNYYDPCGHEQNIEYSQVEALWTIAAELRELNQSDSTIPIERLEERLDEWEEVAETAKESGSLGEYDGIMGSHNDMKVLIEEEQ